MILKQRYKQKLNSNPLQFGPASMHTIQQSNAMWLSLTVTDSNKTTTCLLFFCCSFFFPQLEDDIIAKPDYIQGIRNFAAKQSQDWMILEFSQLGFIGKYYDLSRVNQIWSCVGCAFLSRSPQNYIQSIEGLRKAPTESLLPFMFFKTVFLMQSPQHRIQQVDSHKKQLFHPRALCDSIACSLLFRTGI